MPMQQAAWSQTRAGRRRATWPLRKDFVAVAVMCVIFGLQILAVMEWTGGPEAYSAIATEGMQAP